MIRKILGRRLENWGVIVLAVWSLILAAGMLGNLLVLFQSAGSFNAEQSRVWIVFVLNVLFLIGFSLSFYGLWHHQNWGRLLFLWALGLWAGFGLLALFMPTILSGSTQTQAVSSVIFNLFRYLVSFLLPLLYLNMAHVKASFQEK